MQHERSDVEPRPGHVIRTAPAAGEELTEGEPFLITVSDGPTFRQLPELTGRPFADVATELAKLDLVVELVEQNDEVVPPGIVISWSVADDPTLVAGNEVLPGRVVRVVSSTGPAPRTVPDLVGLTFTDAQATVEQLALGVSETERQFSDTVPIDTVISQTPLPVSRSSEGPASSSSCRRAPTSWPCRASPACRSTSPRQRSPRPGSCRSSRFGAADGTLQSASRRRCAGRGRAAYPRGTQVDLVYL